MQITWKYHTILMTSLQKRFRDELGEAVQRLFGPIHPTIFYVITRNLRKRKLSHLPYMHVEKRKREEIDNKPSSRNQDQPTRILFSEGLSRARKTEVRSRGTTQKPRCGGPNFLFAGRGFFGAGGHASTGLSMFSSVLGVTHSSSTQLVVSGGTSMGSSRAADVLMGASEGNPPATISEPIKTRIDFEGHADRAIRNNRIQQVQATRVFNQEGKEIACQELEWNGRDDGSLFERKRESKRERIDYGQSQHVKQS